jgi:hypothetical protein
MASTRKNQLSHKTAKPKNDLPEQGTVKFIIYHMDGCGHCEAIMRPTDRGTSTYARLCEKYKNTPSVQILDFQHPRDPEARKFSGFPTIRLIARGKTLDYNGARDYDSMVRFIESHR